MNARMQEQAPGRDGSASEVNAYDTAYRPRWRVEDLPWHQLDAQAARANEDFFYLVVCASFIESGSDLYTRNLIDYYAGDPEVEGWLRERWEHEELQHGRALRTYVERVWPEFDWATAFKGFFSDYGRICSPDELEPTRARELVARCVVETGTTAYYRALSDAAPEPVLKQLAAQISKDEVNHFKHFLNYYQLYREREGAGRWVVLRALMQRLLELRDDDAECAIRHAWAGRQPARVHDKAAAAEVQQRMNRLVRRHLPVQLAINMLMKPLRLPRLLQGWLERPLVFVVNRVVLRD